MLEQLSMEDIGRCFGAERLLIRDSFSSAFRVYHQTPSTSCLDRELCWAELQDLTSKLKRREYVTFLSHPDPFHTVFESHADLCRNCVASMKTRAENSHREAWNKLPRYFGLNIEWATIASPVCAFYR